MIRIELHCHTIYSKDSLLRPGALLAACQRKGIDRVAITDHNEIAGAMHAKALDPQRVIIGEEIMTTQGELLAFFVQERIPPHLSPEAAIERLRAQGAFISVSHPFDRWRSGGWQAQDLARITPLVDAIEVFNARCMRASFNHHAADYARAHRIPGTVGSDAHVSMELGRATLLLPEFADAEGLRAALPQAQTRQKRSSPLIHATSRYAKIYKRLTKWAI